MKALSVEQAPVDCFGRDLVTFPAGARLVEEMITSRAGASVAGPTPQSAGAIHRGCK